jgi:hypothetical protein
MLPASTPYVVSEDTIKVLNGSQSVFNYTVSIWIYVDNWEVSSGLNKPILNIADALDIYLGSTDNTLSVTIYPYSETPALQSGRSIMDSYSNLNPEPYEGLTFRDVGAKKKLKESFYGKVSTTATTKRASGKENFANDSANSFSSAGAAATSRTMTSGLNTIPFASELDKFTASVPAIPLQSWTNITVGIHDKAIDIYINGKLTQSNLFPFVPAPVKSSITLTPSPGFIGWTSNFQYYPRNLTPAQIESIYKGGYTGSRESLLSLLGRYSMKIVFVDNTQQA